ncbi:hypothetical protein ZIOFF_028549 [Zingiber officinale]|uniref:Retroviral polymerase SH3-like domain-containing protein n=1 Tax=Zingiber officinale TaxID=94328 RepID=A0A8J5H6K9_ZINOF|nr:hypothetical protein ZIOFF_028549 [Zingiber officinale]
MVYLGVEEGCKAHRLFDPRHGKLQVSRDVMFQENCEWTWNAGANNEEKVPEFVVVDTFGTDEVIVATDIEAAAEDVTTPAATSSPSTPSLNTHTASSPSITNSPESYEGPARFRSIADIYANTEEVVGIDEEEDEVMLISEEPTCYQEAATKAYWDPRKLKQKTVALSSCEAEFMAATTAACHALWLRSLASELTDVKSKSVTLFVDNKSAIALMKNPVFHGRNKHIDTSRGSHREKDRNAQSSSSDQAMHYLRAANAVFPLLLLSSSYYHAWPVVSALHFSCGHDVASPDDHPKPREEAMKPTH